AALGTPAYCWYQNDHDAYGTVYGALYNWYAVDSLSNGNRSICPVGWHIPAEAEWTALTSALGELDVAGGQMKEAGTTHWSPPNTGATNSSGFTALPGGFRGYTNGAFNQVRNFGHWWSRTSADAALAWGEGLFYLEAAADHSTSNKKLGFSIRCVKD
ncbi:MAG TPA: fibrobacter succinogenes major paralogous domain-containing protein, partial [Phycisphaerae bacterium]|nr:fibrobacter succinogenes major paralogous domain-containing protein [Phycisphaerae bacterium]